MTIQECYTALGGNYENVVERLRSERLVQKFVLKFLDDKSYDLLLESIKSGNVQEAFRAAHTIKGMCQNLGFTVLEKSSTALTESLRGGDTSKVNELLPPVVNDYKRTVDAISAFKMSQNL